MRALSRRAWTRRDLRPREPRQAAPHPASRNSHPGAGRVHHASRAPDADLNRTLSEGQDLRLACGLASSALRRAVRAELAPDVRPTSTRGCGRPASTRGLRSTGEGRSDLYWLTGGCHAGDTGRMKIALLVALLRMNAMRRPSGEKTGPKSASQSGLGGVVSRRVSEPSISTSQSPNGSEAEIACRR